MEIFVGNLSYSATEEELYELFSKYGEVASITICIDENTGRALGRAFVEMPDNDAAVKAILALNGKELYGRRIRLAPSTRIK